MEKQNQDLLQESINQIQENIQNSTDQVQQSPTCEICGTEINVGYYCSEDCKIALRLRNRKATPEAYLKSHIGVPERFKGCSLENYDPKTKTDSIYKENLLRAKWPFKESILFTGNAGTGKTHLAVALIRKLCTENYINGMFISACELLLKLKECFDSDVSEMQSIECYQKPDILLVDDIGSEKCSDYVRQAWYMIINGRYAGMQATIYTSNLTVDQISDIYGDRIASRMASGKVLKFVGDDYRLNKFKGGKQ